MTTSVHFEKAGVKDGKNGAWFKGREYKAPRDRKIFVTLREIQSSLTNSPEIAADPRGRWTTKKTEKDGAQADDFVFLTADFKKAMAAGYEMVTKQADLSALPMMFSGTAADSDGVENAVFDVAFKKGTEQWGMPLYKINAMLSEIEDGKNPTKMEFYMSQAPSLKGTYFPAAELIKARETLVRLNQTHSATEYHAQPV